MSDDEKTVDLEEGALVPAQAGAGLDGRGAGGTSIWKKEIGLRKKTEEAGSRVGAVVVEALEAAPDPVAEPCPSLRRSSPSRRPVVLAPVEHDWLTQPLEEVSEPPAEPDSDHARAGARGAHARRHASAPARAGS